MKKVLIITLAAICVLSCGQRRAAKSQESQKEAAPAEVAEHKCCGNHGANACEAEVTEKECEHAVKEACEKVEKTVKEVTEKVEKTESEGATIVQAGRKADPKPIKPVPKPKN